MDLLIFNNAIINTSKGGFYVTYMLRAWCGIIGDLATTTCRCFTDWRW